MIMIELSLEQVDDMCCTVSPKPSKAKLLTERLETMVFECMQKPQDPLFSNELVKLIKEAKKLSSGVKASWQKRSFGIHFFIHDYLRYVGVLHERSIQWHGFHTTFTT